MTALFPGATCRAQTKAVSCHRTPKPLPHTAKQQSVIIREIGVCLRRFLLVGRHAMGHHDFLIIVGQVKLV
jgi:hypothetical protein